MTEIMSMQKYKRDKFRTNNQKQAHRGESIGNKQMLKKINPKSISVVKEIQKGDIDQHRDQMERKESRFKGSKQTNQQKETITNTIYKVLNSPKKYVTYHSHFPGIEEIQKQNLSQNYIRLQLMGKELL